MTMRLGPRAYDWMYRLWAPWDGVGVRADLVALLASGRLTPITHPRAIDLGCGTGANVVNLAEQGFRPMGIDFSPVALRRARQRAARSGVADLCTFVQDDLLKDGLDCDGQPFDLIIDFGTLDDLAPPDRRRMATLATRISRPGSLFLLWCFYADPTTLPRISFNGPSRAAPPLQPGEEHDLFGAAFAIEAFSPPTATTACFLMTKL